MKKSKILLILLSCFAVIVFIFGNQYLNYNNKSALDLKSKFDLLLYKYDDFEDELPVINLDKDHILSKDIVAIDKTKALQDIDYLFSLLKYGYSGYNYFGGDKKFNLAKKNIINSITHFHENSILIEDFIDIIYSNLNFIQDSHFIIGNYNLCNYTKYFSSRKFEFQRDINGIYVIIDDEKFYLKEVNDENPMNYIKPSLDEEGKLIYSLGVLSDTKDVHISINLLLESDQSSRNIKVSLFEYKPIYEKYSNSYNYYEINDTPILDVNALCRIDPKDNTLKNFIEDSKILKEEDLIIIDLRNNIGGNLINIEKWFKGFTGEDIKKDIIESGLYTSTSVDLSRNKFELKESEPESVKFMCLKEISTYEKQKHFPGWSPIEYEEFKAIDVDNNIFVLIDKNTSSAAEFFIYYLKKLNNVTLVGTNSNGCMLTGNSNSAHLPNSKIPLHISHKIYMRTDFINMDGLGFQPDLWVKPEQSLDRIIKYLDKKKGS